MAETHIHVDAAAGFEKLQDRGDFGPVPESLGADIAETRRHCDHRDVVPYRGGSEIVERIVPAEADEIVWRHATGFCPAKHRAIGVLARLSGEWLVRRRFRNTVLEGFTRSELARLTEAAGFARWRIRRYFPYRLVLIGELEED